MHGDDIVRLREEIEEMPEYALHVRLRALDDSIGIFEGNYKDLVGFIGYLQDDPQAATLYAVENRDLLGSALRKVMRLTHNYAVAAVSLIDHTRSLYQQLYSSGDAFPDYQARVDTEFAHDPLSQFVKCLRQYCQHYRAPDISATQSWKRGDRRITRTFHLRRPDLDRFENWSPDARRYLKTVTGEVDILAVAEAYREKVVKFYRWFQSRQNEIHSEALQRLKAKQDCLLSLWLEAIMALGPAGSKGDILHQADDVLRWILGRSGFTELESIPPDSPYRAQRTIESLEKRSFPVSDKLKRMIGQLYGPQDIAQTRREPDKGSDTAQ